MEKRTELPLEESLRAKNATSAPRQYLPKLLNETVTHRLEKRLKAR